MPPSPRPPKKKPLRAVVDEPVFHDTLVVAPPTGPKARVRPVEGYTDCIRGMLVDGWAHDPENPDAPVEVALVCEGEVVAYAMANLYREDLAVIGKRRGQCAFSIPIPAHLMDGRAATLTVRECSTGLELASPALTVGSPSDIAGEIYGLEGAYLTGWASAPGMGGGGPTIELWIDGARGYRADATEPRTGGAGYAFRVRLAPEDCDGRPHEFRLLLPQHNRVVAACAMIVPLSLTPVDALQRYAGNLPFKASLSPVAGLRYESLYRTLRSLGDRAASAEGEELKHVLADLQALSMGHEQVLMGFREAFSQIKPVDFRPTAAPKVSVVIPAHDKFAVTCNCLWSIAAASTEVDYEVIVVDDGSTDQTIDIASIVTGITLVRHETAKGFVDACNAGAQAARGEYLVMLNNDTEVMAGWLDELLEPFNRFDKVGMTGAKLIYPNGRLQEAGGIVWRNGEAWNVGRDGNASDPRYNYARQVDYLSGACIMLPVTLWKQLEGFDRHFAPGYYEDTDLAFRVRAAGFKTVYAPFCAVVHHEGLTSGTQTTGAGMKRFQAINEPKFRARWVGELPNQGRQGADAPDLVQDRNVIQRVLVFDAETLRPDMDAGSYAALQEIRLLQSLGFKVTFMPANLAYMGGYTDALQRMGVEVVYAPFYMSLRELIQKRGNEFDLFYVARYGVAEQVVDVIRATVPRAKIILNIHDLHFLRQMREANQARGESSEFTQRALLTREAELAVIRKVDLVMSYSEVEHAVIISHDPGSTRLALCPWVVETAAKVPAYKARKDVAFLGGFGHRPNVEGVEWFVREVMPLLRKKLPGVRFLIYGSRVPESIKSLETSDIVVKGYVKTTDEVYDAVRVFVSPLLTGAGVKGKVIGAFARGVPQVMTPVAAEATGARNSTEAVVVTKPADWADAITRLYKDPVAWAAMSQSALDLARRNYSFSHGQELMMDALQQVGVFATTQNDTLWSKVGVG